MKFIQYFLFGLLLASYGCGKKENISQESNINILPETEYIEAKLLLDNENYDEAQVAFVNIEKSFPLSHWALRSKVMIIFIDYLKLDYEAASIGVNEFINRYPDYKDIDYLYYLRGLVSYEQIKNPELDTSFTRKSLENFEELIRRFPDSKYSRDSNQKIRLIKTVLAGKDMHIAMYYLEQKKYLAALNRYQKIIDNYEPNKYTPEALHRIVEIYFTLGMINESKKVAAVLGYNYPESVWYDRSYQIVGEVKDGDDNKKNWATRLFKKIF